MASLQKDQTSSTKKKSTTAIVLNKIEDGLETTIFNSRWLLAPFFLGLVISIVLLLCQVCPGTLPFDGPRRLRL